MDNPQNIRFRTPARRSTRLKNHYRFSPKYDIRPTYFG